MRQLLFLLLLFAANLSAQKAVKYEIDFIAADSFYLVERAVTGAKTRPDTLNTHTLFTDTTAYKLYVDQLERDYKRAEKEYTRLKAEADSLDSRVKRLTQLGKNKLGIEGLTKPGKDNRNASAPTPATPVGFWVLYPTKSAKVEFVTDPAKIKKNALILRPDGSTTEQKAPPKKKQ
jgi:hypothetical protein